MDQVGAHLLGHQRETGLLPGQPGRAVRDGGRPGYDVDGAGQPVEALGVGPLADHDEVLAGLAEGSDESVDVASDTSAVGGHRSRVEQHPGCSRRLT